MPSPLVIRRVLTGSGNAPGAVIPPGTAPLLDFSDANNSQFFLMGWI